jgi:hypothetical protein
VELTMIRITPLLLVLVVAPSTSQQRTPPTPSSIPGQVVVEGGGPLPILWPQLYVFVARGEASRFVVQEDGSPRVTGGGAAARVQSDGHFQLTSVVPAGEYTVSLVTGLGPDLPENYSVKSIMLADRDVLKQKLQIPPSRSSTLVITIARNRQ